MNQNLKILLVEDNPGDVRLVEELLSESKDMSYDLHVAGRLDGALDLLSSDTFDVCLLDMGLPDSQGLAGLEKIEAAAPALPIIIRTNLDDEELAIEAVQQGAQDYLVKGTVDPRQLSRVIHYAIERKQAQEALRQSEQKFRSVFETANEGIWVVDAERNTTLVNDKMAEMLGYTSEEIMSLPFTSFLDESGQGISDENLTQRRKGIGASYELRLRRKDGSWIMTLINAAPVIDSDGRFAGSISMITDITERRQAEEALRESEEKYRELFNNANDIVYSLDLDGNVTSINSAVERILGYVPDELVGSSLARVFSPETIAFMSDKLKLKLRGDESVSFYELETMSKDGRHVVLDVNSRLIYENGAATGITGFARDITERKQAEEALQEERDRLDVIMENSPEANQVLLDRDFNFLAVNSSYAESCRLSKEQLIGKNHFDLFPHGENEAIFRKVRDTGEAVEYKEKPYEFPGQPERGVTYWDWSLTPVKDDDGKVISLVFSLVDVTEKVRSRQLNEALNDIYSTINSTIEFDEIMQDVMAASARVMKSDSDFLAMKDREGFFFRYMHGVDEKNPVGALMTTGNAPVATVVVEKGEMMTVGDVLSDGRLDRKAVKKSGIRASIAAPLMVKDRLDGVIAFRYHKSAMEFSQAQIDFVDKLAAAISLALENAKLYENEKESRAAIQGYVSQLSILHNVSLSLNRETDIRKLQEMIVQRSMEMTSAGVGVLLESTDKGAAVTSVRYAGWYERQLFGIEEHAAELWRQVIRLVTDEEQYVLKLVDLNKLSWYPSAHTDLGQLLFGVLRDTRGRVRGLFMLGAKAGSADFTSSDADIVALLAAQSSVALTSAENFEKEHSVAETLQSSLLPEAPVNGNLDLGLLYRSASQVGRIGGDFYDFVELDGDAIAVAVGDVCGKGLYAANYTAMVKYMMRAFLEEDDEPGRCLTRLNNALAKNLSPEKFITMILAIIRQREGTIRYALAGHPAPLADHGGRIIHLETPETLPLGVLPGYEFVSVTKDIADTNSILMFTDGFIESRSPAGEQYGYKRLETAFAAVSPEPAQEQAQSLVDLVLKFTDDNLTDDMAIVVVKPGPAAQD